jgi:hypothetical protein
MGRQFSLAIAVARELLFGAHDTNRDGMIDEKRESLGVSAIARSCESEIPCLSSAGPPLLQRLAVRWLKEQNDTMVGKGERTLALIQDVTSWYKIDSTDPEAGAKSRQLRDFYASFREEYGRLLLMYEANADVLRSEDDALLQEATKESEEVESKLRRLRAMGFE